MKKLKGISPGQDDKLKAILTTAIPYLDKKIKEDYDYLIKYKANLKQQNISYLQVQYLYMRSFFPEYKIDAASQTAYNYYYKQAQQYWVNQSKYMQGMTALALNRTGDIKTPVAILKSLKETSITNEELGMYWKDQRNGWFWYAPGGMPAGFGVSGCVCAFKTLCTYSLTQRYVAVVSCG